MVGSMESSELGLHVLCGAGACGARPWSGALAQFFRLGRDVLASLRADIRLGRLRGPVFLAGGRRSPLAQRAGALLRQIDAEYDIELKSPFEDTASIAGALWSGRELFGMGFDDGLAKLRFSAGTLDLPLHVHEHSDRFIAVVAGEGRFWWSAEPWQGFRGRDIQSECVRPGDVLVFTRNLLHTFSAPDQDLVLLSYHSPEIPFEDPRQYTLPTLRWMPRDGQQH